MIQNQPTAVSWDQHPVSDPVQLSAIAISGEKPMGTELFGLPTVKGQWILIPLDLAV
jgi:hypothetical protein